MYKYCTLGKRHLGSPHVQIKINLEKQEIAFMFTITVYKKKNDQGRGMRRRKGLFWWKGNNQFFITNVCYHKIRQMQNGKPQTSCILFRFEIPVQCKALASQSAICLTVLLKVQTSVGTHGHKLNFSKGRNALVKEVTENIKSWERISALTGDTHTRSMDCSRGTKELKPTLNSQFFQANEAFLAEFLPQWGGEAQDSAHRGFTLSHSSGQDLQLCIHYSEEGDSDLSGSRQGGMGALGSQVVWTPW